jgi:methyltransferase family protein
MSTTQSLTPVLISEEYRKLQQALHRNPEYGIASVKYARLVADVATAQGASELLDYGAGKGRLGEALKQLLPRPLTIHHYDPAIAEWSARPAPCRLVACIDVLEHIEPEYLDNVLDELKRVVAGHGVFTVSTRPAKRILDDGRNAHLIQKPSSWWLPLLMERFELVAFNRVDDGFWVVVEALKQQP